MPRRFNSRPVRNETEHSEHRYPSEGDPSKGIPAYPEPLPGPHHYRDKPATEDEDLDVGPAKPYYEAGMAHGVPSEVHYGGRPAPTHEARTHEAASNPVEHELEDDGAPFPLPVYLVDGPGSGVHPMQRTSFRRPFVSPLGGAPIPLCDQDVSRKRVLFLNEGAANTGNVRLSSGPTQELLAILPGGMASYLVLHSQDIIYAQADTGNATGSYVSVILEYDRETS